MSARLARFTAKHANANSAEIAISPYRHLSEQTASACFELPEAPCPDCGGRNFVLPPGGPWGCAACHPSRGTVGWSFCSIPGDTAAASPTAPSHAPARRTETGEQSGVVYLDAVLPAPDAALGRCHGCRFTAPLSQHGLCAPCEVKRLELSYAEATSAKSAREP